MLKKLLIISIVTISLFSENCVFAATKKKKKSSSSKMISKTIKSKKVKRKRHHGNGPDLKKITSEENFKAYEEKPINGINSIEKDN